MRIQPLGALQFLAEVQDADHRMGERAETDVRIAMHHRHVGVGVQPSVPVPAEYRAQSGHAEAVQFARAQRAYARCPVDPHTTGAQRQYFLVPDRRLVLVEAVDNENRVTRLQSQPVEVTVRYRRMRAYFRHFQQCRADGRRAAEYVHCHAGASSGSRDSSVYASNSRRGAITRHTENGSPGGVRSTRSTGRLEIADTLVVSQATRLSHEMSGATAGGGTSCQLRFGVTACGRAGRRAPL